jgi:hypothetical protein
MLSTRQLYRSNNQPASYAALTQFAPEPARAAFDVNDLPAHEAEARGREAGVKARSATRAVGA